MTKSNHEILVDSFKVLDDERLGNFRWHLENKTPVFCGKDSDEFYTNSKGFGWPHILAGTREVTFGANISNIERISPDWLNRYAVSLIGLLAGQGGRNSLGEYLEALAISTQPEVRSAMAEASGYKGEL